jgi:hypothetical protein
MMGANFHGTFGRGLARVAATLLCLTLFSGCTFFRVGYGQLDTFAVYTADEYFELEPQQKQEFRTRFDRLHAWHRTEQLPDYATFLGAASDRVQKGPTGDDVLWIVQGIEERYRVLARRGSDDAAALLMTVTPAQIETLKRKWEKDNARYAREQHLAGSADEQRQARAERELKRIKEWVGELSADQEKRIAALNGELPLAIKLRYEDRLRRQREFLQLMATRGDDVRQFSRRLRHFLVNWEEGRSPEFQRAMAEWRQKQAQFYVEVARQLSPQQRSTLARRVESYAQDFTQLAQR